MRTVFINPDQLFICGQCSTVISSTTADAGLEIGAQFKWGATFLPAAAESPKMNSTIGGALWTLKGKSADHAADLAWDPVCYPGHAMT